MADIQPKKRKILGEVQNEIISSDPINIGKRKIETVENAILNENTVKTIMSEIIEKNESMEVSSCQNWIDVDLATEATSTIYLTEYVNDIFQYYRSREERFKTSDYMSLQKELTISMRAVLVDWLVEVQQNFELNHEDLYTAVKLVDLYLSKNQVIKDRLQLVGAVALNIAAKFEDRCPPILDDYVYVCADAYVRIDFTSMERKMLLCVDFDLGMPLSYTFLRRYAQCARVNIKTLTLARYILETSLMDYQFSLLSESLVASAALLVAMTMNDNGTWDSTMLHYTNYVLSDLESTARKLNQMLLTPPHPQLNNIVSKYSHEIFHEVAKIPCLKDSQYNNLFNGL